MKRLSAYALAWVVLIALCGVVSAQPTTIAWRPPTSGCSSGYVLTFNGLVWTCSAPASTLSGLTTNRVLKAGSATTAANTAFPIDDAAGTLTLGDNAATDIFDVNAISTFNGALWVRNFATDGDAVLNLQNDARVWKFQLLGSAGDAFVLQDETGGVNALTCAAGGACTASQLLTGTLGFTTPANLTTTGTGDVVSGDDLTVADDSTIGDDSSDRVGLGIAPDTNHPLTFAAAIGNKIALYPVNGTTAYGFGIQSQQLQVYVPTVSDRIDLGYGDSDAFTSLLTVDGDATYTLAVTGTLNTSGTITENGTAVLSGAISSNVIPKGSGGNLVDSAIVDNGTNVIVSREIDAANNLKLSAAADDYIYASLAASSGNQNIYLTAAGTGIVRVNHNGGGLTNGGTGGLIVYGGANSATPQVTLSGSGAGTFVGNLSTNASLTAGDATTDSHTMSGLLTATSPATNGAAASYRFGGAGGGLAAITYAGNADNNGGAYLMHNAYAAYNTGGNATWKWTGSHASFGARGIWFDYASPTASGIKFFADQQASTADSSFTPTGRFLISNNGQIWGGDTGSTAIDNNVDVLTIGNTGTHTSTTKTLYVSNTSTIGSTSTADLYGAHINLTMARDTCETCGTINVYGAKISAASSPTIETNTTTYGLHIDASSSGSSTPAAGPYALWTEGGAVNFEGATVIDDTLNVTGAGDFDTSLNVDGALSAGSWTGAFQSTFTNRLGDDNTDTTTVWGHFKAAGTAPTPSSCGTSPAVTGTDYAGYFTTGSGGGGAACTVTFSRTMTNKPSCIIWRSGNATGPVCTVSATAITCTTTVASTEYHYQCVEL